MWDALSCFCKTVWELMLRYKPRSQSQLDPQNAVLHVISLGGRCHPQDFSQLSRLLLFHSRRSSHEMPSCMPSRSLLLQRRRGGRFISAFLTCASIRQIMSGLRTECVILGYFCSSRAGPDMFLLGTHKQSESLSSPTRWLIIGIPWPVTRHEIDPELTSSHRRKRWLLVFQFSHS